MEFILIYFIIKKIESRTKEYEYNSAPHIKLAVLLWLVGEVLGFLIGSKLGFTWPVTYLIAVGCGGLGGFFVFFKVMQLPRRNLDYFDLQQTKAYPYFETEPAEAKASTAYQGRSFEAESAPAVTKETMADKSQTSPEAANRLNQAPIQKAQPEFSGNQPSETTNPAAQSVSWQPQAKRERVTAANNRFFKFPYSELFPLEELFSSEYGLQTVKDQPASEFDWFSQFKMRYENREIRAALSVLENALYEDIENGFIWLLYGGIYKDIYQNYEKALQFCLTGAKRCNSYKSALLTEAAEVLLLGMKNVPLSIQFFCYAITVLTEASKAWDHPGATGAITQERAFHYIRIFLTVYNFNDYRMYLERNVRFHTGLDQKLIERVIAICNESSARAEAEVLIRNLFPLIIEKLQALG